VTRRIVSLLADDRGPRVLVGSDTGALFAAALVADGAVSGVSALVLAGLALPEAPLAPIREVVGHFATGVAVVTAAGPDGPSGSPASRSPRCRCSRRWSASAPHAPRRRGPGFGTSARSA
jgi:hypothetical protein